MDYNPCENFMPVEWSLHRKICYYLNYITVEPTLYLYMMAFMITTVLENAFFIDKACRVNHHLNDTICSDIANKAYSDINKQVQVTVSNFNLFNDIAGHTGQIFLALFMGAWSDKHGRKLPLLIGLIGKFYYSCMIVVNALQPSWPLEYIVYTATLPSAFSGADVAIFASAFSYLVDVSSSENRTLRLTFLEVIYLSTMPTGIALGSYLFRKVFNKSYTILFLINATLMFISIVYSWLRLKRRTLETQTPLPKLRYVLCDFFDYNNVVSTFNAIFKKRAANRKTYLLLLIAMMSCFTFQRDEKNVCYLYLQNVFHWTFGQISNFSTFRYAVQDVGLIVAIPLMSRVLGWRDSVMVMVGALAHIAARIFFIIAETDIMFYTGGALAALGPIVGPVVRSMVSKIVADTEKGSVFSILSVADNAIPLVSGVLYSKLYNLTISSAPQAIFYLTMLTQLSLFLSAIYIYCTARTEENLRHTECEEEADSTGADNFLYT